MSEGIIQLGSAEAVDAIGHLQELLKFETVSATAPENGEYRKCARFLFKLLSEITVLEDIHFLEEAPDHSPVVVARW